MARVFIPTGRTVYRARLRRGPGDWFDVSTGETDPVRAEEFRAVAQAEIDAKAVPSNAALTFRVYVERWLKKREAEGQDWKKDRGRLETHVMVTLGPCELAKITHAQIAALIHHLRFETKLAPRTVRNVYGVIAAVFRDAADEELIPVSPCRLTKKHLGEKLDKHPEWRGGAQYDRHEVEAMIADPRIPFDRQMVYAICMLAGLRPGETSAIRWRHYNADAVPLGRLTIAWSYSTTYGRTKETKTKTVRTVPVHPVLAQMLLEWRAFGWERMMGRAPTDDDLIVPLPPDYKRRTRSGQERPTYYTLKRWNEIDEPQLGWRHRTIRDTRPTFITLCVEDGANRQVLRDRVTHTRPSTVFDGYDRGTHWDETCREVGKLKIQRRATALLPACASSEQCTGYVAPEEGLEAPVSGVFDRSAHTNGPDLRTECDRSVHLMGQMVASRADAKEEE